MRYPQALLGIFLFGAGGLVGYLLSNYAEMSTVTDEPFSDVFGAVDEYWRSATTNTSVVAPKIKTTSEATPEAEILSSVPIKENTLKNVGHHRVFSEAIFDGNNTCFDLPDEPLENWEATARRNKFGFNLESPPVNALDTYIDESTGKSRLFVKYEAPAPDNIRSQTWAFVGPNERNYLSAESVEGEIIYNYDVVDGKKVIRSGPFFPAGRACVKTPKNTQFGTFVTKILGHEEVYFRDMRINTATLDYYFDHKGSVKITIYSPKMDGIIDVYPFQIGASNEYVVYPEKYVLYRQHQECGEFWTISEVKEGGLVDLNQIAAMCD